MLQRAPLRTVAHARLARGDHPRAAGSREPGPGVEGGDFKDAVIFAAMRKLSWARIGGFGEVIRFGDRNPCYLAYCYPMGAAFRRYQMKRAPCWCDQHELRTG